MLKIVVFLLMTGMAVGPVMAQQGPTASLKTFGVALDSLGRDSTLGDSGGARVRVLVREYKGFLQKLVDSISVARKVHKVDTVVVVKNLDSVVKSPVRRDVVVKPVLVVAVDSVRALIAGERGGGSGGSGGGSGLLIVALLLIGVGGVGWGLYVAGRKKAVRVSKVKPVVEVKPVAEVKEALIAVEAEKVGEKVVEKVGEEVRPVVVEAEKGVFVCELMMTAGPRKKFMNEENADKDLGEDVCGCVVRGDVAAVWLLDGTSDQFCLRQPDTGKEYFSSRLLAQDIGDRLRGGFQAPGVGGAAGAPGVAGKAGYVLDRMMTAAVDAVRLDWVKVLRALPGEEREVLAENIRVNNCPECSSTMLAAVLALDGKATAYRSGDSKLVLYQAGKPAATSFVAKNPESNDRIFFRIVLDSAGQLDILSNTPAFEVIHEEGVGALAAFSDGVGGVTEEALKTEYGMHPVEIRRRIGNDPQGTADDKSICFVRITEE